MKILIVSTSDLKGGAAKAAYRLHHALLKNDIDSQMLVQSKNSDDFTVLGPKTKIGKFLGLIRPTLDNFPQKFYKHRQTNLFSPAWLPFGNIIKKINDMKPDIVHLHGVCGGMMRIEEIADIKAPVVWSLHDSWAFTGGCRIIGACEKYKEFCGACPSLGSKQEYDLSRRVFQRKQKVYEQKKEMTIVGVSRWMSECSQSSTLLKDKKHINLPNPIDTNTFKPLEKGFCRDLWNLPRNKKLILFGAMSPTSDVNKGFKELSNALQALDKSDNVELVVFGSGKPLHEPEFGFKTHYLGKVTDDVSLVTLYNAVDVTAVPSRQEAFGQVASEAMACGTPVVAFGHTGLLDIVDHKVNGYLAKPLDTIDFKDGILWILNHSNYHQLSFNAREKVVNAFESDVVAKKYIKLYQEVLNA